MPLLLLPAFSVGADSMLDRVEGKRVCLDHHLAAQSVEISRLLCQTIRTDSVAFPRTDVDELAASLRDLW